MCIRDSNLAAPYSKKYGIKLNKNDLSQDVSGKVEPGQNKLYILGLALNVNEAWLMAVSYTHLFDFLVISHCFPPYPFSHRNVGNSVQIDNGC